MIDQSWKSKAQISISFEDDWLKIFLQAPSTMSSDLRATSVDIFSKG